MGSYATDADSAAEKIRTISRTILFSEKQDIGAQIYSFIIYMRCIWR